MEIEHDYIQLFSYIYVHFVGRLERVFCKGTDSKGFFDWLNVSMLLNT